jgi:hypothetical protein
MIMCYATGCVIVVRRVVVKGMAVFQDEIERITFAAKAVKVKWARTRICLIVLVNGKDCLDVF